MQDHTIIPKALLADARIEVLTTTFAMDERKLDESSPRLHPCPGKKHCNVNLVIVIEPSGGASIINKLPLETTALVSAVETTSTVLAAETTAPVEPSSGEKICRTNHC